MSERVWPQEAAGGGVAVGAAAHRGVPPEGKGAGEVRGGGRGTGEEAETRGEGGGSTRQHALSELHMGWWDRKAGREKGRQGESAMWSSIAREMRVGWGGSQAQEGERKTAESRLLP